MKPQLITLGSPRPRNDNAAAIRIALATVNEPVTMIGESVFGRIHTSVMLEMNAKNA